MYVRWGFFTSSAETPAGIEEILPRMPDIAGANSPAKSRAAGFFRFLELLGAAVLVGGLCTAGAIGWLAFNSPDILSREQAGRFMAKVFEGSLFVEAAAVG